MALLMHPRGRVVVPVVALIGDRADRGADEGPPLFVVERSAGRLFDEPAATACANASIETLDQILVEMHMNTHASIIAHL